ncbi:VanR-ABDEGLN family response regulator transcription factor [Shouchella patagoniensis]|uniref:VanR-ABDEGLN family response regulator transcription factor n=1 Tax=Shouchella patagoniensis TaxID=228576 RepID=UPI000994F700|nr:VanR-ABDEGLN family response regulator transcription factor [Shouchella patagoniensis]
MAINILVVDDEKEIADLIKLYLELEHYVVHTYYTAEDALKCIEREKLDLAILDVMLPGTDGFSICRKIREKHNYPVIMLTAKDGEVDKITGLTLGADDYMTKPFRPLELVARVKAQLRRFTTYNQIETEQSNDHLIAFSGLILDKHSRKCVLNEKPLVLTPKEFSILWFLCLNRGRAVSSEELFQEVWGEKYFNSNNTVMVHIRHLREKMNDIAENRDYIKTVWGVGYMIE